MYSGDARHQIELAVRVERCDFGDAIPSGAAFDALAPRLLGEDEQANLDGPVKLGEKVQQIMRLFVFPLPAVDTTTPSNA